MAEPVRIGTAGWAIAREAAALFDTTGTHLERYARRFNAVEINSSFYRPHRHAAYQRWAASVPEGFRFSVKLPREITHRRKLADASEPLTRFLDEIGGLGARLGPILVQLPPSLRFDAELAGAFFTLLRARHDGGVVCEPRHASWFEGEAEDLLAAHRVGRVAADPPPHPGASAPGGWPGLVYYRWHGAPQIYYSAYPPERLSQGAYSAAEAVAQGHDCWFIFDNTALGAAALDANVLGQELRAGPTVMEA